MSAEPNYDSIREQGRRDALQSAAEHAPGDPLARVAWAQGWGQEDQLRGAVMAAREAGASWATLASVLGVARATVQTRFGTGAQRKQRYREGLKAREQSEG